MLVFIWVGPQSLNLLFDFLITVDIIQRVGIGLFDLLDERSLAWRLALTKDLVGLLLDISHQVGPGHHTVHIVFCVVLVLRKVIIMAVVVSFLSHELSKLVTR